MKTKIILTDDHILIREGIKQLLEFDGSMEVVAQAGDGLECLKVCDEVDADILLLDINMPNMSGLDALKELRKKKNPIKVLILTVHNETEYLVKATEIGVDGYILKDSGIEELKSAINVIVRGESFIQPSLIPALNNFLINKDLEQDKISSLTKRELEILKEVSIGKINKEIAIELNITERTVKNHMVSIFKKIDVNDRTQAAVFAIKNNLVNI